MDGNERTCDLGEYKITLNKLDYETADRVWKSLLVIISNGGPALSQAMEGDFDASTVGTLIAALLRSAKSDDLEDIYRTVAQHSTVRGPDMHGEILSKCERRIFVDTDIGLKTTYQMWVAAVVLTGFFTSRGDAVGRAFQQIAALNRSESPKA